MRGANDLLDQFCRMKTNMIPHTSLVLQVGSSRSWAWPKLERIISWGANPGMLHERWCGVAAAVRPCPQVGKNLAQPKPATGYCPGGLAAESSLGCSLLGPLFLIIILHFLCDPNPHHSNCQPPWFCAPGFSCDHRGDAVAQSWMHCIWAWKKKRVAPKKIWSWRPLAQSLENVGIFSFFFIWLNSCGMTINMRLSKLCCFCVTLHILVSCSCLQDSFNIIMIYCNCCNGDPSVFRFVACSLFRLYNGWIPSLIRSQMLITWWRDDDFTMNFYSAWTKKICNFNSESPSGDVTLHEMNITDITETN